LFDRILIVAGLFLGALSLLFLMFCFFGGRSVKQSGSQLDQQFQAPSSAHWLGLDEDGQDILDRIRVAGRKLTPPCLATLVGVILLASPLGLLSGYYETRTARLVERLFDVLDSVPKLVLVLLAIVVFEVRGAYLWKIIPFIGMTFAPAIFYQVREGALLLRQRLFVERAWALGCSEPRIVFLHILWKNCLHRVVIASAFMFGGIILMDASIGYLNLSQPDYPTWGGLVAEGIASADDTRGTSVNFNSWALWGPAGVLAMMLMSFTLAAEALERLWTRD
jgi:glutathione transport system permease protein